MPRFGFISVFVFAFVCFVAPLRSSANALVVATSRCDLIGESLDDRLDGCLFARDEFCLSVDTPLNCSLRSNSFPSQEGNPKSNAFDAMSFALQSCINHHLQHDIEQPKDTIEPKADTVKTHSVKRAALFSAVVPGLGQVYNKQYWKVPVLYAGGAFAGYLIYYNYSVYNNLRKSFRYRKDDDTTTSLERFRVKTISGPLDVNLENFSDADVLELQQTYRRDLDLSVLLAAGIYALNIVDAVVFAHLYDFDVSEDLALRVKPDFRYAHNGLVNNGRSNIKPMMQVGLTYRF